MLYEFIWTENKTVDWKICTVKEAIEGGKEFTDVSINRFEKGTTTVAFPTFDDFKPGATVEASIWVNPAGKAYLFAPKPKNASGGQTGGNKGGMTGMKAAQERKAENIKEAQENRGHGIKVAAAMRDATLFTIALMERDSDTPFKDVFKEIKDWYLKEWNNTEKQVDVPFN